MVEWLIGRHHDPTPVKCSICGWEGRLMDAIHTYRYVRDDVEPVDLCPRCRYGEV